MRRFLVTASLQLGSAERVAEILREGPPFDLATTSLERHEVYLGNEELVFLFEGPDADAEARRLFREPHVLSRLRLIRPHLQGTPKLPREVFSWERPHAVEGVVFGPDPGPGDSDGGAVA